MRLADLPAVIKLAKEQEGLAELAQLIEDGTATIMIHIGPNAGGAGMKSVPDAVSYGAEESMMSELLKGIGEMQKINRDALAQYGVTEE